MSAEDRRVAAADRILSADSMEVPHVDALFAELGRPGDQVAGGAPERAQGHPDDRLQRLWTPYRMAYIKREPGSGRDVEDGCPFCRIPTLDDETGLVVARGELVYAVLNLHPYNPGHLMVVTFRHVAELEDLTLDELTELTTMTRDAVLAVKAASRPQGFNVGINLGSVAGGSLADHIHQHVVPRWNGDANFMTVLGHTKLMPQLLADTRELIAGHWPAAR